MHVFVVSSRLASVQEQRLPIGGVSNGQDPQMARLSPDNLDDQPPQSGAISPQSKVMHCYLCMAKKLHYLIIISRFWLVNMLIIIYIIIQNVEFVSIYFTNASSWFWISCEWLRDEIILYISYSIAYSLLYIATVEFFSIWSIYMWPLFQFNTLTHSQWNTFLHAHKQAILTHHVIIIFYTLFGIFQRGSSRYAQFLLIFTHQIPSPASHVFCLSVLVYTQHNIYQSAR